MPPQVRTGGAVSWSTSSSSPARPAGPETDCRRVWAEQLAESCAHRVTAADFQKLDLAEVRLLFLFYVEDFTTAEIAQDTIGKMTGKPVLPEIIRQKLFRILSKLRRLTGQTLTAESRRDIPNAQKLFHCRDILKSWRYVLPEKPAPPHAVAVDAGDH